MGSEQALLSSNADGYDGRCDGTESKMRISMNGDDFGDLR